MLRNEESVDMYGSGMLPVECIIHTLKAAKKEILYLSKFAHMVDAPSVVGTVGLIDTTLKMMENM